MMPMVFIRGVELPATSAERLARLSLAFVADAVAQPQLISEANSTNSPATLKTYIMVTNLPKPFGDLAIQVYYLNLGLSLLQNADDLFIGKSLRFHFYSSSRDFRPKSLSLQWTSCTGFHDAIQGSPQKTDSKVR
jgi:hypothetical protein